MDHQDNDPRTLLLDKLGDLGDFEVFNNQVLVAIYVRPQRTKSGIYLTDKAIDEDVFQGKVGLMVKTGPTAFADPDGQWFKDAQFEVQDWLVFRPSDGWAVTVNEVPCRILQDTDIRGRVQHPDQVW